MAETYQEVPLMEAARTQRLNREQMLRRALQQGSAIQRDGRWFIQQSVAKSKDTTTDGKAA